MLGNRAGFMRAKLMFAAIAAALAQPGEVERRLALGKIRPYVSRGKGRGGMSYANGRGSRGGNNAGRGAPHHGPGECAKRKLNLYRGLQSYGSIQMVHQRGDA